MTDKEILILTPLYEVKEQDLIRVHLDVREQLKHGNVVVVPFGWKVVTKPSNIEVEVAEKTEEESTPWDFIDNSNHSPFDSQGKERLIFCTKCGIYVEHYDAQYQYCPYCGKRHYFEERGESCSTCKNNDDDEFSGECYECVKNIQNHYEKGGE